MGFVAARERDDVRRRIGLWRGRRFDTRSESDRDDLAAETLDALQEERVELARAEARRTGTMVPVIGDEPSSGRNSTPLASFEIVPKIGSLPVQVSGSTGAVGGQHGRRGSVLQRELDDFAITSELEAPPIAARDRISRPDVVRGRRRPVGDRRHPLVRRLHDLSVLVAHGGTEPDPREERFSVHGEV